jgi:FkbM family methyltransferase
METQTDNNVDDEEHYKSQWGQDRFVDTLMDKMRGGVFVDIGAADGITLSNSFFFEKRRGWTGICVEPLKEQYDILCSTRSCVCINACVFDRAGSVKFKRLSGYTEMLSGIEETYDPKHVSRIQREMEYHGGKEESIEVPCDTLTNICKLHGVQSIDYLSIDTEGSEYNIVRSLDFDAISIKIIGIEHNYADDRRVQELLESKGFDLICNLGGDDFYRNRSA